MGCELRSGERSEAAISRARRSLSRTVSVLAGVLVLAAGSPGRAQVIDDFEDDDDTVWTHFDPSASTAVFSEAGGEYSISVPTTNNGLDPARAGSQREGGLEDFDDVIVAVDLVSWNDVTADQGYGFVARASSSPSQGDGYALNYATGVSSQLRLVQIDGEIPSALGFSNISFDPSECHRLVLRITGSSPAAFSVRAALCSDPATALTTFSASDSAGTIYTSGVTGLTIIDLSGGTGSPQATFDNFFADYATGDADSDGLTNEDELLTHGTDPASDDTDGDGLLDGAEVNSYGSDPFATDTDGDGLSDGDEVNTHGSSPVSTDTDADGMSDPFEVTHSFDPADGDENSNSVVDSQDDFDSDGLGNAVEGAGGTGTDPNVADTDSDGLLDGAEIGTGSFGPQQIISTLAANPISAQSLYVADLDGDGDLDVLSASSGDDEIAWYENTDGQGSFGSQQVISNAADYAYAVFAADLDGDGDLDALSASYLDDEIAWYENTDGAGTFGSQQIISTAGDGPVSVVAADLDGDGDLDVLAGSLLDDEVAWYENTDGAGNFGSQQIISTAADSVRWVATADVDGDGDPDVLSTSSSDDEIAWYENTDGLGSFGAQQIISTAADWPYAVVTGDLDGDGDLDALSASSVDDELAWYENTNGLGSFGAQQLISSSADGARSIRAADLDLDGDVDALTASAGDDTVAWYANTDGQGSFGAKQTISTAGDGAGAAIAADVDGDGDPDVVAASGNDSEIAWYEQLNVSDPHDPDSDDDGMLDGFEIANGFDPLDPADGRADADADGLSNANEAAAGTDPNVADSDGDGLSDGEELASGSFGPKQTITSGTDYLDIDIGDLDGDGDADLVGSYGGLNWIENTDGQGTFAAASVIGSAFARGAAIADIDGDSDHDILFTGYSFLESTNVVAWHENQDGLASFGSEQAFGPSANLGIQVATADLDGDQDADAISYFNTDGLSWYENTDGGGSFGSAQSIDTSANSAVPADLDGDGDSDLLASSGGSAVWFENTDGLGTFSVAVTIATPAGTMNSAAPADLDGDGDLDVLLGTYLSPDSRIEWSENTDGQGTFGTLQTAATLTGQADVAILPADADGDGDVDVFAASLLDDEVAWYENTDGLGTLGPKQVVSTAVAYPQQIRMADLDGDADLDALVEGWIPQELVWFEQLNLGDPLDPDSDDDGLLDGFEVANGFDPLVAGEQGQDPDGDGLDNLGEQAAGTDPGDPDSDGDGFGDGHEVGAGTNPLNPNSYPLSSVPALPLWALWAVGAGVLGSGIAGVRRNREVWRS